MSYTNAVATSIDLRLSVSPEVEDDPKLHAEATKIYNALRNLAIGIDVLTGALQRTSDTWAALSPADTIKGQNLNRLYLMSGDTIIVGNTVNLYDGGGGVLKARRADATNGSIKQVHGFATSAGDAGSYIEVIVMQGLCNSITGLTTGAHYYQSTTVGLITAAKPAAPNLQQAVGVAVAPTLLLFNCPLVP